jgi:anti-sigma-K factor RskA
MTERHANPEDSDLYALGALDGEELQAFEAHVRSCSTCGVELEAARQRVALLGLTAPPVAPPPSVKENLMRRVRAERVPEALRADRRQEVLRPEPHRRFAWLTPALGTAAVFFAALAAVIWMKDLRDSRQIADLQSQLAVAQSRSIQIARAAEDTDNLLGMPGTMRVSLAQQPGGPSGRAGVLYNAQMGMVMFAAQVAPAPTGKSYQLWMVPASGAPMSLGVFSTTDPTMAMSAHVPPGLVAKAFAVTLEPAGGMPQPTGPKVLVGVPS